MSAIHEHDDRSAKQERFEDILESTSDWITTFHSRMVYLIFSFCEAQKCLSYFSEGPEWFHIQRHAAFIHYTGM